jgi:hypothetical protein
MDVIPAAVRTLLAAAVLVTVAACSAPAEPTRPAAPLANTFDSAEALTQAVLSAIAANDRVRLLDLALSESEFRELVWPELPTSRPERNVPLDYAWGQLKQNSDGFLQQTLARYGGKPLRFVRLNFTGETTQYQSFRVMRDSEVVATDDSGRDLVLRLFGAVLVKDGRYKVFSYVVDD